MSVHIEAKKGDIAEKFGVPQQSVGETVVTLPDGTQSFKLVVKKPDDKAAGGFVYMDGAGKPLVEGNDYTFMRPNRKGWHMTAILPGTNYDETIDICKKYKSNIILRGLRAVSDFEYEFQLAGMNRKLNNNIETIFLMSDVENQIISSRFVKEIIKLKGDIRKFTTKSTIKSLKEKYE